MQNVTILHFFKRIFGYIKKKQYLCSVKLKQSQKLFYILAIRFNS